MMGLLPTVLGYLSEEIVRGLFEVTFGWRQVTVVLLCVWVGLLPFLLLRAFNTTAIRCLGGRGPDPSEWTRLESAWQRAQAAAGVRPGRYALLIVRSENLLHRDLGLYVVTVTEDSFRVANDEMLVGILAQRLARQTSLAALLTGLCLWAVLPMGLVLGLLLLVFRIVSGIMTGVASAGNSLKPKTDGQAAVVLVCYFAAFGGLLVLAVLSLWIAFASGLTIVVMIVVSWLARQAEMAADGIAAQWGFGPALAAGLARLTDTRPVAPAWRRLFSTTVSLTRRIGRIERPLFSPPR
jgi:hypothetical protein